MRHAAALLLAFAACSVQAQNPSLPVVTNPPTEPLILDGMPRTPMPQPVIQDGLPVVTNPPTEPLIMDGQPRTPMPQPVIQDGVLTNPPTEPLILDGQPRTPPPQQPVIQDGLPVVTNPPSKPLIMDGMPRTPMPQPVIADGNLVFPPPHHCQMPKVWNDCETACPKTCGKPPATVCTKQCVSGCSCPANWWRVAMPSGDFACVERCPIIMDGMPRTPMPQPVIADGNLVFPPPQCQMPKVWNDCETACPKTCGQPLPSTCTMQCVAGCTCPVNWWRVITASGFECVHECPIIMDGVPNTPVPPLVADSLAAKKTEKPAGSSTSAGLIAGVAGSAAAVIAAAVAACVIVARRRGGSQQDAVAGAEDYHKNTADV